jgi:putative two-component system response regulator
MDVLQKIGSFLRFQFFNNGADDVKRVLPELARKIEAKDPHTLGHADRVSQFAVELGTQMGVSDHQLNLLRTGGLLHDIGKIAIPDSILLKPGKYTPEEYEVMKRHPVLGCDICEKQASIRETLPMIRHHHEKLDGSGYPDGLSGDKIPLLVRMVTIVDIYDALRSKRSYKEAFNIDKTFEIMWEEAGKGWWDKDILSIWESACRASKTDPFIFQPPPAFHSGFNIP